MNKLLTAFAAVFTLTASLACADVMYDTTFSKDPDAQGNFRGTITAVETERDSVTVVNDEGIVRMFAVSPEQKSSLNVGERVTVSYTEAYQWPLSTSSLSGSSSTYEK